MSAAQHHKFSPSSYPFRSQCNGWQPGYGPSAASLMGTRCHVVSLQSGDFSELHSDQEKEWCRQARDITDPLIATADEVFTERFLEIRFGEVESFGYADLITITDKNSLVADLKFGGGYQPHAEDHTQIHAYMLGAADENPGCDTFTGMIIQPPRDEVTQFTTDRAGIEKIRANLIELWEACSVPDPNTAAHLRQILLPIAA